MMNDERRIKRILLSEKQILTIFNTLAQQYECISLPHFPTLPEGYRVLGATHCHDYGGISLLIYHESFPEVQMGEQIPMIEGSHLPEMRSVKLAWENNLVSVEGRPYEEIAQQLAAGETRREQCGISATP